MSALESLRIAMRALRVNKLRSALDRTWDRRWRRSCGLHGIGGSWRTSGSFGEDPHAWSQSPLVMPGARNSGGARLESGTQPTLTEEDAASIRRELKRIPVILKHSLHA